MLAPKQLRNRAGAKCLFPALRIIKIGCYRDAFLGKAKCLIGIAQKPIDPSGCTQAKYTRVETAELYMVRMLRWFICVEGSIDMLFRATVVAYAT